MRRRETVNTTLGELIVAVTDEVMPFIRDPTCMYTVVSCIVSDLLTQRARLRALDPIPPVLSKN